MSTDFTANEKAQGALGSLGDLRGYLQAANDLSGVARARLVEAAREAVRAEVEKAGAVFGLAGLEEVAQLRRTTERLERRIAVLEGGTDVVAAPRGAPGRTSSPRQRPTGAVAGRTPRAVTAPEAAEDDAAPAARGARITRAAGARTAPGRTTRASGTRSAAQPAAGSAATGPAGAGSTAGATPASTGATVTDPAAPVRRAPVRRPRAAPVTPADGPAAGRRRTATGTRRTTASGSRATSAAAASDASTSAATADAAAEGGTSAGGRSEAPATGPERTSAPAAATATTWVEAPVVADAASTAEGAAQ